MNLRQHRPKTSSAIARFCASGAIALSCDIAVHAETAAGIPSASETTTNHAGGREHFGFRHSGGPSDGAYIDQWLEMLKQRNPDEFARMKKLREENPEEFRHALRQKLQDMRMKGGSLRDHPQVAEAIKNLPQEDRDWVIQRLQMPPPGMPGGNPEFRGDGGSDFKRGGMSADSQKSESQVRELAQKFRASKSDDERAKIRTDLRDMISRIFDEREKRRDQEIQMFEDKIAKIRKQLAENKTKRDQIIDTRLKEITAGDAAPK